MHINSPRLSLKIVAPDRFKDPVAGQHPSAVLHQELQQGKFLEGEGDLPPRGSDAVAFGVQGDFSEGQRAGNGSLRGATAQHRLDPGDHFDHPKRLGDVIVCTQIKSQHPVVLAALRGQHDNRDLTGLRILLHLFEDSNAILPRQHDIQQNQLRRIVQQLRIKFRGVGKALCLKAAVLQRIENQFADRAVILNAVDHPSSSPLCTPVIENSTHSAILVAWSPIRS